MSNLRGPMVLLLALSVCSCALPGYYGQAINGELQLLSARQPLAEVIANPGTPAAVREQLQLVGKICRYASAVLGLPKNGSYTSYVALDQPDVLCELGRVRHRTLFIEADYLVFPGCRLRALSRLFPPRGCRSFRYQAA